MAVLSPGEGKSALATCLCCELARRTLIVAPDTKLVAQWKEAIAKWAPDAKVGIVCGSWNPKKHSSEADSDFVLTTDESASGCEYPSEYLKQFGTVVIDEAHTVASRTHTLILPRLPARYIIGLSATPTRADGLEHALYWLMGPCVARYLRLPEVTLKMDTVDVYLRNYGGSVASVVKDRKGEYVWHRTIDRVSNDEVRNDAIADTVEGLVNRQERAKVVVLVRLRDHVKELHALFGERGLSAFILFGGKGDAKSLEDAKDPKIRVLVGTYSFLSTGYDDPRLDTIVIGMPISSKGSNLVQSVGRIERMLAGKKKPMIVDVVDRGV